MMMQKIIYGLFVNSKNCIMTAIRTATLIAIAFFMVACASGPPGYKSGPEGRARAEALATSDPAEILHRWGDLGAVANTVWIGEIPGGFFHMRQRWLVPGSVMEVVFRTHMNAESWGRYFNAQYNPELKRIDYYHPDEHVYGVVRFGKVQADGSVRSEANSIFLTSLDILRTNRNRSELILETSDRVIRMRRTTMAHYEQLAEQVLESQQQDKREQEREDMRQHQAMMQAISGTLTEVDQAYEESRQATQLTYRAPAVASYDDATSTAAESTNTVSQFGPTSDQAQAQTTQAGAISHEQKVVQYRATEEATAWCKTTKSGKYTCTGPLQKMLSTEASLDYALELAGCKNGSGDRPPSASGSLYRCNRELRSGERRMPAISPY
jgi:hypothetical protein